MVSQDRIKELMKLHAEGGIELLKEEINRLKSALKAQQSREVELAKEVLSVWNEDGENGEIQMKTPIAWHRVLRKAEQLIKEYNEREDES